ncbi:MAG: penicillin-binding protein activator [Pseudomonadota bacterium]
MFALLSAARNRLNRLGLLAVLPVLAACDPGATLTQSLPNRAARVDVALLVPAGTPDGGAELAASFENAARLAAADLNGVEVTLRLYDTAGQAGQAAAVAQAAVNDGADIILGPLFGDSAVAAGAAVAGDGVNVMAFSNNPTVAGGNVFILGSTFQSSADRLVGYAAATGRSNVLIVQGDNAAEASGTEAISRAIANQGARLAGVSVFPLSQEGVINAIPTIADEARATGADVLFMTSGNDGAVPFLADLLPENGIDPTAIQFAGLQRLDVPASALSLGGLQGAWFALPDPGLAGQFQARYQATYGTLPHPLASLAYDGVAAIGALAGTDGLSAAAITRPNGFAGVNGIFRFLPGGTNERGLAVAQIQNQQVVVIDPAPRSFGAAGL